MRCSLPLTIVIAILVSAECAAFDGGPLREARSANRRFSLRIEPGRLGRSDGGCRATLYGQRDDARRPRRIWEHALVNDVAPEQAFIRDDGRFVITLDEFRRGGARHAVVIYGERGELLRHFLLIDLLGREDWSHVETSRRALRWLDDALCAFDDSAAAFVIRLKWGREIRIDLRTLQVLHEGQQDVSIVLTGAPPEVLALLLGHLRDDSRQEVADQLNELAGLTPEEKAQADAVAAALAPAGAESETPSAQALAHATDGDHGEALDEPRSDTPDEEPRQSSDAYDDWPVAAQVGAIRVPMPDAADPVDYVAWLNDLGRVDGPDADPVYGVACEAYVAWDGDSDLYRAALDGDPEALASPEIAAWLESNQRALEAFREASRFDAKGWDYSSPDGSLLQVLLPTLSPTRKLGRASVIDGRKHALAGEPIEAAERYLDALAAGAHVGAGMTIIENLVGIAVQSAAADAMLDLQADAPEDALDYAELVAAAEAAYRAPRPVVETIQGERAFFLDTTQRLWKPDPRTGEHVFDKEYAIQFLSAIGIEEQDPAALAEELSLVDFEDAVAQGNAYWDKMTQAATLPYPAARQRFDALDQWRMDTAETDPFTRAFAPALGRYLLNATRAECKRRGTLLATRANAYYQEHGEYPPSLAVLGQDDVTTDPFSNAAFVYLRDPDGGFTLYSVGEDGLDDGGSDEPDAETGDVLFWPRPTRE